MIKPIVIFGNPILRQVCLPYSEGTDLKETIQDMRDTMYNANGGGLAAPQIGIPHRLFVIDLPDQEWKKVFINPTITTFDGEDTVMTEGCLSIPSIEGEVIRKDRIVIDYYNEDWIYVREEYHGIRSRVIQHEYDHLEGKLWVDKMIPKKGKAQLAIMSALQRCQKKTIVADYPIS
jgi:peptide deformylase